MLNYINKLRGQCPEGQELQFFKIGGKVCKKCAKKVTMEDGGKTPTNVVDAFIKAFNSPEFEKTNQNIIREIRLLS